MKNLTKLATAAFGLGLLVTTNALAGGGGLLVKIGTEIPYSDMVKRLNSAIKAEKMNIVTRASASKSAKIAGHNISGNMVVGVFRNDYARRLLTANVKAGIEAPIRFYINERRDGSALLSYKTPSMVLGPYIPGAEPELVDLIDELDIVFDKIAKRATKEN